MTSAIAIETSALDRLQSGFDFDVDWFQTWSPEHLPSDIVRVDLGEVIYLLGPKADADSRLLVIDITQSGLFDLVDVKNRPEAFLRLVRIGRSAHSRGSLPVPTSWSPFNSGSLISIQSNHQGSGERGRVEIDLNPRSTYHAFAYKFDRAKRDLHRAAVDYTTFDEAVRGLDEAVIEMLTIRTSKSLDPSRIVLPELENRVSLGRSLKDWLEVQLTKAQLEFIKAPLQKSVRLVGAAGTGKTLSMVVKCLLEYQRCGGAANGFRCLFLTHSQSTVDTVQNAISSMDHDGSLEKWPSSILKICTLQELANEAMKYDLHGLQPLSNDGLEGRRLQIEAIESQIESLRKADWVMKRQGCSVSFRSSFESARGTSELRTFAFELMNEFACVLDADGVRQSGDKRERYLSESRKSWMMPLENAQDRDVVLVVYNMFRDFLRELGVIGVDQMISDYLGILDSNRWDNVRQREGFDVIYVDELHLFNRQERMVFHNLMRNAQDVPIVVMAYDSKQSARDTFYGLSEGKNGATVFARDMRLGETQRFELGEAFRYTPEIAKVLEWVDQTFPTAGISDELGPDWAPLKFSSGQPTGERPILIKCKSTLEIFRTVFPRARRVAINLQKGRRVAILCSSESLFKKYSDAGEYQDQFIVISDREQLSGLKHAGRRYVLSMPEFVAGIQFDTVFLIEVNDGEVEKGPYSTGALRRFISMIYLGASRAERILEIYASDERGGPSKVLRLAVDNGALDVVDVRDLG